MSHKPGISKGKPYSKGGKVKKNNIFHKSYLIYLKYSPHFLSFMYVIYTILEICGIDWNLMGCIFKKV